MPRSLVFGRGLPSDIFGTWPTLRQDRSDRANPQNSKLDNSGRVVRGRFWKPGWSTSTANGGDAGVRSFCGTLHLSIAMPVSAMSPSDRHNATNRAQSSSYQLKHFFETPNSMTDPLFVKALSRQTLPSVEQTTGCCSSGYSLLRLDGALGWMQRSFSCKVGSAPSAAIECRRATLNPPASLAHECEPTRSVRPHRPRLDAPHPRRSSQNRPGSPLPRIRYAAAHPDTGPTRRRR